jgi:uroporphyrinogen-III synthase
LITRPQEDAEALSACLIGKGYGVLIEPMLEIERLPTAVPDLTGTQGLLFTSANGVRACGSVAADVSLPVYAVGAATAAAARDVGFATVWSAGGDVAALAKLVIERCDPMAGSLLHIAASDRAGDLSGLLALAGFTVRRAVLYRARAATVLSAATTGALAVGAIDAVLLFSPRTAKTLTTLVATAGLLEACQSVAAVCLSTAVAEVATAPVANASVPISWRAVRVAERPDQEALLTALEGWRAGDQSKERLQGLPIFRNPA